MKVAIEARCRRGVIGSLLAALLLVSGCATDRPQEAADLSTREPASRDEEEPGWTPIQLSLVPGLQAFDRARDVAGLRLALVWSENRDVSGIDLSPGAAVASRDAAAIQVAGIVNRVKGNATGLQLSGLVGWVEGSVTGIQIAGVLNRVGRLTESLHRSLSLEQSVTGIQIAGLSNHGNVNGLQIAPLTNGFCGKSCGGTFGRRSQAGWVNGVQIATVNDATEVVGAQLSAWTSHAKLLKGLQIASLLSWTEEGGQGVQIAGWNIGNGDFSGLQVGLLNMAESMTGVQVGLLNFNGKGFLPVLPIFNFGFSATSTAE